MISVGESMSKKSRRNSTRSRSLQTPRKFHFDERVLRGHLERRAQQAVLGKNSAQRKLFLTEYDLEIQNLERRNSEYALIESQRELESQRRQLLEANQWADQAQRETVLLCSELEMKNRLHQECDARRYQEIEELKRRCCKEENGVTQQKLNEYSMRTVSLLRDQVGKLRILVFSVHSPRRCGGSCAVGTHRQICAVEIGGELASQRLGTILRRAVRQSIHAAWDDVG